MDGVWDVVEDVHDQIRDEARRKQAKAAQAARRAAFAARRALHRAVAVKNWSSALIWYRALQRRRSLQESPPPKLAFERKMTTLHSFFPATNEFRSLRMDFLQSHGAAIRQALSPYWGVISLDNAPLNPVVQMRFLRALAGRHNLLQPAFHGTNANNLSSIFSRGLLIPGSESEIRVVNGSAHGVGIYTARLRGVSISMGFNRESARMLVCAVIDDALESSDPERLGNYMVTARSSNVHHVGDAMVVFDDAFVVPLLIAEKSNKPYRRR